jgi:hypothetical protein
MYIVRSMYVFYVYYYVLIFKDFVHIFLIYTVLNENAFFIVKLQWFQKRKHAIFRLHYYVRYNHSFIFKGNLFKRRYFSKRCLSNIQMNLYLKLIFDQFPRLKNMILICRVLNPFNLSYYSKNGKLLYFTAYSHFCLK